MGGMADIAAGPASKSGLASSLGGTYAVDSPPPAPHNALRSEIHYCANAYGEAV